MKKFIAVTVVALMMFAFAASSFALVAATTPGYKNPPVFIDGLTISDAWMSGLTVQNWQASLTNQAYAEGSYIWFIAKIGVAANGDTDAQHLWDGRSGQNAELTITGKDNCLNFTSANMATLSRIAGMSVDARSINNSNLGIVEATANKVKYTFTPRAQADSIDANRVLIFNSRLESLELDAIYPADVYGNAPASGTAPATWGANTPNNRATLQKDFYLHFMAITKASTEGVATGVMKVNGTDTFKRAVTLSAPGSYTSYVWYASPSATTPTSDTQLNVGDRSQLHLLFNTYNGKTYSVMKIKNGDGADTPYPSFFNTTQMGPYGGKGHIYVVMNKEATEVICGFVVDGGSFLGLVKWNKDDKNGKFALDAGQNPANGNEPWRYEPVASNDFSNNAVEVIYMASGGTAVSKTELQAIFDFFGFSYGNPNAPGDGDFLARSGLTTTAEAKYNVANAVIATPDTSIVVPKTGDAATSTGLILVASAILAAAAVGFVLSKRAHN